MRWCAAFLAACSAASCGGNAGQAPPPRTAESAPAEARATTDAPRPSNTPGEGHGPDKWSSSTSRTFGWVSIAVGAEGAAVGIATSFMLLHQNNIRDDSCNAQHLCSQAGITANDNIRSLAWWNTGAWVVAAAGLGVGAFLLLTNPSDATPRAAVGVTPNGSGLNVSARSVF